MVLVIVNCDQICESIAIDISYGHEFEAGVILVYDSKIDLIETFGWSVPEKLWVEVCHRFPWSGILTQLLQLCGTS
jgi:hypothetical protein